MLKPLQIGEKIAKLPIIQGGMGVGISRCKLAGAVAKEGGVGIISTAQIGYDEEGFEQDQAGANLKAIAKHIKKAKEIAQGNGLVGVNVMVALKHYKEHVEAAVAAGADVVICGAGLPIDLPAQVPAGPTKLAPIVSSRRAAELLLKKWDHQFQRTADFIVIEGPLAGGHLGFHLDQLQDLEHYNFDHEIQEIIAAKVPYEAKYQKSIPVIVAGGVFDHEDIEHMISLGADGVQIASRFVATEECDACESYKQAYINATSDQIQIVKSPVGMPGRALRNEFIKHLEQAKEPITKCYNCIKSCNPAEVPYCITKALVNAVEGDLDHGLIFCGANVDRINSMSTVHALMQELAQA
ncbi:MAG: nitronate monooxygenase [Lachnospiraceae bacterium]|nr:nitronate monooxygenase [Lachnospiraceae bacterium]